MALLVRRHYREPAIRVNPPLREGRQAEWDGRVHPLHRPGIAQGDASPPCAEVIALRPLEVHFHVILQMMPLAADEIFNYPPKLGCWRAADRGADCDKVRMQER